MSTDDSPEKFPRFLPRVQDGPARFDEQVEKLLGKSRGHYENLVIRVAWRLTGEVGERGRPAGSAISCRPSISSNAVVVSAQIPTRLSQSTTSSVTVIGL